MKKELLESLKGLAVGDATSKIAAAGLRSLIVNKGSMLMTLVEPNTVVLWDDCGMVDNATASDPSEVR